MLARVGLTPKQDSHLSSGHVPWCSDYSFGSENPISTQLVISPVRKLVQGVAKRLVGGRPSMRIIGNSTRFSHKSSASW